MKTNKKNLTTLRVFKMRHNKKKLIAKLDRLVSEYVRKRDKRCVTCNKTTDLTCSHLITRGCMSLRFNLMNCNAQCKGCNLLHEYRPERYTQWWINKYGLEEYEALVTKSKQIKRFTEEELEALIQAMKQLIKEVK